MADVWELTDPERGDHVLIALTPEECQSVLEADIVVDGEGQGTPPWRSALEQVRRSLRDQKGIEV